MDTAPLNKLDRAKKLELQISEATKHKELINKIIGNHSDAGALPPVCVKTNAQYSNFMVLTAKYLPIPTNQFWTDYLNNVDIEIDTLKGELDEILK